MRKVRLAEVVRRLPRHGHDLPRRTVASSQRWRMIEAITEVSAKVGYADASVAGVIAAAGVSRKTFYEHFRDKEDCFLTAYDVLSERLVARLVEVGAEHADPRRRRRAQLELFLAVLADDLASARVFMLDVLGAGPRALRRRARVNERFGEAFLGDEVPADRRRAVVGGVNYVVSAALLEEPSRLAELAEPLREFVEDALGPWK